MWCVVLVVSAEEVNQSINIAHECCKTFTSILWVVDYHDHSGETTTERLCVRRLRRCVLGDPWQGAFDIVVVAYLYSHKEQ